MRSIYLVLLSVAMLFLNSCESENERRRDNNSFLPNNNIDITLEIRLNTSLSFNNGELFLSNQRAPGSLEGIYIFRASPNVFFAYDLAEPNHPLGSCSIVLNEDTGVPIINAENRFEYNCDGQTTLYDSLTGQQVGDGEGFGLRAYTVFPETNGDQVISIRITG